MNKMQIENAISTGHGLGCKTFDESANAKKLAKEIEAAGFSASVDFSEMTGGDCIGKWVVRFWVKGE